MSGSFKKFFIYIFFLPLLVFGQQKDVEEEEIPTKMISQVEVKPITQDIEIEKRLTDILNATAWFNDTSVEVKEGVVFLFGQTKTIEFKKWAGSLAGNTQNVVAVVNKIEVIEPSPWNFSFFIKILKNHWLGLLKAIPSILIGIIILFIAGGLAQLGVKLSRNLLKKKFQGSLPLEMISRLIGIMIFLIGVYLIFEMANLTGAALTIISGTGIAGIILGIAFRDITENFLASILLSIHNPFHKGDLIEVSGFLGYVQKMTMRATILMSLDGNHIQIPNSVIYKNTIRNYSSNPNRREEFSIGIGYNEVIAKAQELALNVLAKHEAVLKEPESLVLVDSLGKSTINLRIYFWLDGSQHSWLKVRSSVIRLIKRAFQAEGISMPDEAREIIFPKGLAVQMHDPEMEKQSFQEKFIPEEPLSVILENESGLHTEAENIKEQAEQARPPEEGKNLLKSKNS